jgi:WD40 repeat protein
VATGGDKGTVKLWDPRTGQLRLHLHAHNGRVERLAFSPDSRLLATAGRNQRVKLWDTATGQPWATLEGHEGFVRGLAFSPDGRALASGGEDGLFLLWDISTRRARAQDQDQRLGLVAFDPDGRSIFVEKASSINRYEVDSGRRSTVWTTRKPGVRALAVAPDGKLLAAGHWDGTTDLWDVASQTVRTTLPAGKMRVMEGLAFSPDGHLLAAGGTIPVEGTVELDRILYLHQLTDTGAFTVASHHAREDFGGLAFAPDGQTLAAGELTKGELFLWRPFPAPAPAPISHAPEEAWCVAFSPDGKMVVSGGDNEKDKNCLRLWDAETGRPRWAIPAHEALVTRVAFSPDGAMIATGCFDGSVKLWDPSGREIAVLPGATGVVESLAFSPDGRLLAIADRKGGLQLWDVAARRWLRSLGGHPHGVRAAVFHPNGLRLITAGETDGTVRFWDVATGRLEREDQEPHPIYSLAFSSDGRNLALGGKDGRVQLWDLITGQKRILLADNPAEVRAVAFTPNGCTLASAGMDAVVRLWDPSTGYQLLTLSGPKAPINALAFSPDGRTLAAAFHNGQIELWRGAKPDEPQPAESRQAVLATK